MGNDDFSEPLKGTFRLLEEGYYQYGFVSDRELSIEKLMQFQVLIMPNVAALSDEHAKIIHDWVSAGGKLIDTFQSSLFDELGIPRSDFALRDVFGVHYDGTMVNTEMDCYQKVITRNDILLGFDETRLLHNSRRTLMIEPNQEVQVITGYLPKINSQPPENAFPENWDSGHPIVVLNKFGKGQVVYFANEAARLNYTIGHPDYMDLLSNSINILMGSHKVLKTNAPASVHVYLNQDSNNPDSYQLSLVNTSSSTHRPPRDLIPVSGIKINLPFTIKSYESLYSNNAIINVDGDRLHIDNLDEFCSVKLRK